MKHVSRLQHCWGLAIVILGTLLIFSLLPLGTAFEFGNDESYEVIKALMCSKGYHLYTQIWNDQPPVSTMVLVAAFKLFGTSILTARLVASGFGLILFVSLAELVRLRSGQSVALLATFFLLAAPSVLLLSVSVMLEVPAVGTGLLSAWLLFRWGKNRHWGWLAASGVVMGIALQIKLTAILVAPAMIVELLLLCREDREESWLQSTLLRGIAWGSTIIVVFSLIGATWGKGSLRSSWKSHTAAQVVSGFGSAADHPFDPQLLRNHVECVAATLLCLALVAKQKRFREVAFPLTMLLTAVIIHTLHRPWWNYYYLHFAVPLAWLSGVAINEVLKLVFQLLARKPFAVASRKTWLGLAFCAVAALAIARSERRLEGAVSSLARRPKADANPVVKKMREYAGRTKWVYADSALYPFHAQLLMPPEITIVMLKRFWSGQISTANIVATCKKYQVEQLVLPLRNAQEADWKDLLDADYALVTTDGKSTLYVAKRITETNRVNPELNAPAAAVH